MKTLAEQIDIMRAALEGKPIQYRVAPNGSIWTTCTEGDSAAWNWGFCDYRVKPCVAPGHNPEEITPEQVGKGWRLLTEEEFEKVTFLDGEEPEYWDLDWVAGGAANPEDRSSLLTYRTNLPEWWLRLPVAYRVLARKNLDEKLGLDARGIDAVFIWGETPEGAEFWLAVHRWLVGASWNLPPLPAPAPKTEAELWWEKLPESFPGCVRTEAAQGEEGEEGEGKTLHIFFFSPSTNKVKTFTGYGYTKDEAIRSIRAQLDAAGVAAEEAPTPPLNQMITELVGHEDLLSISRAGAAWRARLIEYPDRNVAYGTTPEMAVKELWLRA